MPRHHTAATPGTDAPARTLVTADGADECVPEVDASGRVVGRLTRRQAHDGTKRLHPVVHLHVVNAAGHIYLQHRARWKTVQPDRWDTATGGHIDYGETPEQALAREVYEEIGLAPGTYRPRLLMTYVYESEIERELVYVYATTTDQPLAPSPTETQGGRYWTPDELAAAGADTLTPMFRQEYPRIAGLL